MDSEVSLEEYLSHFKRGSYRPNLSNNDETLSYNIALGIEPINQLYGFAVPRNDGSFYDVFMKVASDLEESNKAVYLSLLMSEKQLLQIVNNSHLFDDEMISSAYYLLSIYNNLQKVELNKT